jgi:alginate O-acetyltransferase complex protein AlgI
MLFNSFAFLFVFLPVTYSGAILLLRIRRASAAISWLVLCSLAFYAYWNPAHLWVVVASILANYGIGAVIANTDVLRWRRAALVGGIGANLVLLGYFKYADFFAHILSSMQQGEFTEALRSAALPIGISFYTFTQIGYLVDTFRERRTKNYGLGQYALFVTMFPHLIAGPIVQHSDIVPQFKHLVRRCRSIGYVACFFAPGLAILTIGLAKKVILADAFGDFSDDAFNGAISSQLNFLEAWGGAIAYSLQIYFDFSGYSDMAIGLALLFGVKFPVNFLSPYKATSIIDFWRRWHITLSRFLRDFIYIPLGGNRRGRFYRYLNLLITMVLGGLWHGAGWTFILWGFMHGMLLAINHLVREIVGWRPPVWIAVPFTFFLIVLTWVPFRAADLQVMMNFYQAMSGMRGIVLPLSYANLIPDWLQPIASWLDIRAAEIYYFSGSKQVAALILGIAIVFILPSSSLLTDSVRMRQYVMRSLWIPLGLGVAGALSLMIMLVRTNTTFLYFQF